MLGFAGAFRLDGLGMLQPGCVHAHIDLLKITLRVRPYCNPYLLVKEDGGGPRSPVPRHRGVTSRLFRVRLRNRRIAHSNQSGGDPQVEGDVQEPPLGPTTRHLNFLTISCRARFGIRPTRTFPRPSRGARPGART